MQQIILLTIAIAAAIIGYLSYQDHTSPIDGYIIKSEMAINDFCRCGRWSKECLESSGKFFKQNSAELLKAKKEGYEFSPKQQKKISSMLSKFAGCMNNLGYTLPKATPSTN
jgi:hypothetical protein